jgi:hypothetical protein
MRCFLVFFIIFSFSNFVFGQKNEKASEYNYGCDLDSIDVGKIDGVEQCFDIPEKGDVVIYFDKDTHAVVHCAVVTRVENGTVVEVESKWNRAGGVYRHDPGNTLYGCSWAVYCNHLKRPEGNQLRTDHYYSLVTDQGSVIKDIISKTIENTAEHGANAIEYFNRMLFVVKNENSELGIPGEITGTRVEAYDWVANCVGYVFDNGHSQIAPSAVRQILRENGYCELFYH